MSTIVDFLPDRETFKHKSGAELAGPCPWCGGEDRFVVITDGGQDGKGRYWCRQCGAKGFASDFLEQFHKMTRQEAREALGLPGGKRSTSAPDKTAAKPEVLMPVPDDAPRPQFRHPKHGAPSATWAYHDTAGRLLGYVCRFDLDETDQRGKARKEFCPRIHTSTGWRWQGFPEPRPLYGLQKLAGNAAPSLVLLVEGEGKADALQSVLGPSVAVLGLYGGCKAVWQQDFTSLAGRQFIYWPDADAPGAGAALSVAEAAGRAEAAGVRIVAPPTGVRETWDGADAVKEGWDSERLAALFDSAVSPAEFRKLAADRWGVSGNGGKGAPAPRTARPPLKVVNLRELLSFDIPPRGHVLTPVIPEQGLAMLYAPRGTGKTFVGFHVAYAVASGGSVFAWKAERPRRTLYLDGEMPVSAVQKRFADIVAASETEPEDDFLRIVTPDLQGDYLMPNLATQDGQAWLEPHLDGVDFLVVDNLATLARTGRSNSEDDWGPVQEWILRLRRQGKAVLLIHHAGKNGSQRGTGAKEDVLDTVVSLTRPSDYEPEQGARFVVSLTKARGIFGPDAEPFEAQLVNGCCWKIRSAEDSLLEQVKRLLGDGLTVREIAEETGKSKSSISRLCVKHSLSARSK